MFIIITLMKLLLDHNGNWSSELQWYHCIGSHNYQLVNGNNANNLKFIAGGGSDEHIRLIVVVVGDFNFMERVDIMVF